MGCVKPNEKCVVSSGEIPIDQNVKGAIKNVGNQMEHTLGEQWGQCDNGKMSERQKGGQLECALTLERPQLGCTKMKLQDLALASLLTLTFSYKLW